MQPRDPCLPWRGKLPARSLGVFIHSISLWNLTGAQCPSSAGKESTCNAGDLVRFLGQEDPQEKGKVTHSSTMAWRIPWTMQSMAPHPAESRGAPATSTGSLASQRHPGIVRQRERPGLHSQAVAWPPRLSAGRRESGSHLLSSRDAGLLEPPERPQGPKRTGEGPKPHPHDSMLGELINEVSHCSTCYIPVWSWNE